MQKYKTYKIISLTKQQPIFICRAVPTIHEPNFTKPLEQYTDHQKPNFLALRQRMTKVTDKLLKTRDNSFQLKHFEKRSASYELPKQQKLCLEARQMDQKRKKQKSIKEYLKFVYNRAEKERRNNSYQLPSLKKQGLGETKLDTQTTQYKANQLSERDLKDYTMMKRKMRSVNNRAKYGHEQKSMEVHWEIRMDRLSGWDQKQEELV